MKMTMENSDDLAIETLLAVRAELAPDLDTELLKRCFAIQKRQQFASDRTQSAQAMDRLIEECVNSMTSLNEGGEFKK